MARTMHDGSRQDAGRAAGRVRSLKLHLLAYFAAMAVLVAINLLATPGRIWFVWPMVGWGPILAIHTAWAMGLFDTMGPKR
jgi:2TM domain